MRTLVAFLVVASGLSAVVEPADAQKSQRVQKQKQSASKNPHSRASTNPHSRASNESYDAVRAADVDPARNYKAFPDWARAAFGSKRGGR